MLDFFVKQSALITKLQGKQLALCLLIAVYRVPNSCMSPPPPPQKKNVYSAGEMDLCPNVVGVSWLVFVQMKEMKEIHKTDVDLRWCTSVYLAKLLACILTSSGSCLEIIDRNNYGSELSILGPFT